MYTKRGLPLLLIILSSIQLDLVDGDCCGYGSKLHTHCGDICQDHPEGCCADCSGASASHCCGVGCNIFCCDCDCFLPPRIDYDYYYSSGNVTELELKNVTATASVDTVIEPLDKDKDGKLNLKEFSSFARKKLHTRHPLVLEYNFAIIDKNGDGYLDGDEIDPPMPNITVTQEQNDTNETNHSHPDYSYYY